VSEREVWLVVLLMGAITVSMRASFIVLQERLKLPGVLKRGLVFVPAAVLAAMFIPAVFPASSLLVWEAQLPRFLAAAVGALVALRTQNMMLVLIFGMATLWLVQALLA
jgi:branched-subunit amino acid transport protein